MPALICGSLAFDTITTFPGRFAQQILPEQIHILNVSFLVPTLKREFGGCAGNIAYTLAQLGGEPVVLAAAKVACTVGRAASSWAASGVAGAVGMVPVPASGSLAPKISPHAAALGAVPMLHCSV